MLAMEDSVTWEKDKDENDVIEVENLEDLARLGLCRIQIEGVEQEHLLDGEGIIYNLEGQFVVTTGDNDEEMKGEPEEG